MRQLLLLIIVGTLIQGCSDGKEHIRLYNQACDYEDSGDYQKSIELLSKAIEIKPDDLHSYNNRAWDYLEFQKKDSAIRDFKAILKISPKNTAALYGLGYIHYLDSNYVDAIAFFDEIIKIKGGGPIFFEPTENKFIGQEKPLAVDIKKVYDYKELSEQNLKK